MTGFATLEPHECAGSASLGPTHFVGGTAWQGEPRPMTGFCTVTEVTSYSGRHLRKETPCDSIGLTYHFCPKCGSTVYWDVSNAPDFVGVAVGNFTDPTFPTPAGAGFEAYGAAWALNVSELHMPFGASRLRRNITWRASSVISMEPQPQLPLCTRPSRDHQSDGPCAIARGESANGRPNGSTDAEGVGRDRRRPGRSHPDRRAALCCRCSPRIALALGYDVV
jgi:hypothetical protein